MADIMKMPAIIVSVKCLLFKYQRTIHLPLPMMILSSVLTI